MSWTRTSDREAAVAALACQSKTACQRSWFHDSGALEACVICACRDCLACPTLGDGMVW